MARPKVHNSPSSIAATPDERALMQSINAFVTKTGAFDREAFCASIEKFLATAYGVRTDVALTAGLLADTAQTYVVAQTNLGTLEVGSPDWLRIGNFVNKTSSLMLTQIKALGCTPAARLHQEKKTGAVFDAPTFRVVGSVK